MAAIEEATQVYRELAAARTDAFRPHLAASLTNLAPGLGGLGLWDDALAAIEEAVTIRQELAARCPDGSRQEMEESSRAVASLEHGEDLGDLSPLQPE